MLVNASNPYGINATASATYPSLKGKSVFITGGGGGIGAALVAHFAAQGANVAFCDINPQGATTVCNDVQNLTGKRPIATIADLSEPEAIESWFNASLKELGGIDCLINNAGSDQAKSLSQSNSEFFDTCVSLNLRHQYLLAREAATAMRASGGSIINMGSISWMLGVPGVTAYTTMKAAIAGMTNSMARELGESRIRVNSIAPGWVLTNRQIEKGRANPEKFQQYLARQSWKEHLVPADIAKLALWLASDDAAKMTGQTIILDGGIV